MKFKSIATLAAVAALLGPIAGWAATVSISPAVNAVAQGTPFSVTVKISGLSAGDEIASAFDLGISYDTSKLTYLGATFLAETEFGGGGLAVFDDTNSAPGDVNAVGYSLVTVDAVLQGLQGDGFDLFELKFQAANVDAVTFLNFSSDAGYSPYVIGVDATELSLQLNGACVAIGAGTCDQPIPEPASYALVAIALGAAGLAGRSRKRATDLAAVA